MQNILASFQHLFISAFRADGACVEENSRDEPTVKSPQAGKSLPETYAMSEIGNRSSQKNNGAARSGEHHGGATRPIYLAGMEHPNETPQITADIVLQHINRNEIDLLQSDIEAGFQCEGTCEVNGKSITPFEYAMWEGNVDALKVLLPHTHRNNIVLAFLNAYEDASLQDLYKILPAAKEVLIAMKSQPEMKYPLAHFANVILRIEGKFND